MNRLPEKLAKPAGVLKMVVLVETAVSSGRMTRLPEKLAKPAGVLKMVGCLKWPFQVAA